MRKKIFLVLMLLGFSVVVLAQVGGGDIVFKTPKGDVVFSHENHVSAGKTCTDCHPKPYVSTDKRKKVTMAQMYKGESCGKCHNGKVAFSARKECNTCHKK